MLVILKVCYVRTYVVPNFLCVCMHCSLYNYVCPLTLGVIQAINDQVTGTYIWTMAIIILPNSCRQLMKSMLSIECNSCRQLMKSMLSIECNSCRQLMKSMLSVECNSCRQLMKSMLSIECNSCRQLMKSMLSIKCMF